MKNNFKISGFKIPQEYFEQFDERLLYRMGEEKFPKHTGFKVPENYFDGLEIRILDAKNIPKQPTKVISLFDPENFKYFATVAACLLIGVFIFINSMDRSTDDDIELTMLDKYIEEGNLNLDLYELSAYFEADDIPLKELGNQTINQTILENYLLENSDEDFIITISSED